MESSPNKNVPRASIEVYGEVLLLMGVGAFFVYLFVQSLDWPLGASLMPQIAVAIGTPFLIARLVRLAKRATEEGREIMDMGFRWGTDRAGEARRFIRICVYIAGLYLGIWVFGMHVALPLGLFFYLMVYGRAGWLASTLIAALFLALIIGVYDNVLHANWHEPLVLTLWNSISSP